MSNYIPITWARPRSGFVVAVRVEAPHRKVERRSDGDPGARGEHEEAGLDVDFREYARRRQERGVKRRDDERRESDALLAEEDAVPGVSEAQMRAVQRQRRPVGPRGGDARHGEKLRRLGDEEPHDREDDARRLPRRPIQALVPLHVRWLVRIRQLCRRDAAVAKAADDARREDDEEPCDDLQRRQAEHVLCGQDLGADDEPRHRIRRQPRRLDGGAEQDRLDAHAHRRLGSQFHVAVRRRSAAPADRRTRERPRRRRPRNARRSQCGAAHEAREELRTHTGHGARGDR
mmetsp:Transcript_21/g.85  ORF Transcript_21/g.85 Transcript_21/m.85 type:complete len:289 (+) Transcript_21:959-1825(+)